MAIDLKRITTGGEERVPQATNLLYRCFLADPVINYILNSHSKEKRRSYMPTYFDHLLSAAALNGGSFMEIDDWSSCSVWIPPGRDVANPSTWLAAGMPKMLWNTGIRGCYRMLFEYSSLNDPVKKSEFNGSKDFHYLFFIGTVESERSKGLGAAMIRNFQAIAEEEGKPIWLEATTTGSVNLYLRLGFKIVKEFTLGEGRASEEGEIQRGGPGVPVRAMVWWPSTTKAKEVI